MEPGRGALRAPVSWLHPSMSWLLDLGQAPSPLFSRREAARGSTCRAGLLRTRQDRLHHHPPVRAGGSLLPSGRVGFCAS